MPAHVLTGPREELLQPQRILRVGPGLSEDHPVQPRDAMPAQASSAARMGGEHILNGADFWRSRRGLLLSFWAALTISSSFAMIYIYTRSWYILLRHGREPCDVPLSKVMSLCLCFGAVYLLWNRLWRWACRFVGTQRENGRHHATAFQVMLLGWACFSLAYYAISFGMGMVKVSRTCQTTAPDLYRWAAYFFPSGVAHFFALYILVACSVNAALYSVSAVSAGEHPSVIDILETAKVSPCDQCSVCLDSYMTGQQAIVTPCCGNTFHRDCLEGWLKSHRSCPLCRQDLQETVRASV